MSGHWINLPAFRWAYEQDQLGVTAKAVLVSLAIHSDERGYAWPSVALIASTWGMDRETVSRQLGLLLSRRMIFPTKKRYGSTGQVKAYRLPKCTWARSGECRRFAVATSDAEATDKSGISTGKSGTNRGTGNTGTTPTTAAKGLGEASLESSAEEFIARLQSQYPQFDVRAQYRKYLSFCAKKKRPPHRRGFERWMARAEPELEPLPLTAEDAV